MLPINLYGDDDGPAHERERRVASPAEFLLVLAFVNMLGFAGWQALINNFAREQAGFGWFETGLNQSVREIPGFLAFTAVFWLLWLREQVLAYASLILMAAGIGLTGMFPTLGGILLTTLVMSIGFHYYETVSASLQLQLLRREDAAASMGRIHGAGAAAQFVAYGSVFLATAWLGLTSYATVYVAVALAVVALTWLAMVRFPRFEGTVAQRKEIVLRRRYWLYYALTFMSGARRQIFSAFGAFLLVDRFGLPVDKVALLYLATALATTMLASRLGRLVGWLGERRTMILENIVLVCVFAGYAMTGSAAVAVCLFLIDGVSMTLMLAQRTYFQKIGDPADMAATASVAFTFNHIAAVVIPVVFGLIGHRDPSIIFWLGAAIAAGSLGLAVLVPQAPSAGHETLLARTASPRPLPQPAE